LSRTERDVVRSFVVIATREREKRGAAGAAVTLLSFSERKDGWVDLWEDGWVIQDEGRRGIFVLRE